MQRGEETSEPTLIGLGVSNTPILFFRHWRVSELGSLLSVWSIQILSSCEMHGVWP
jgi:hypothetical protein